MQHVKMLFVFAHLVFLLSTDVTGLLVTKSGVDVSFNLSFPEAAEKPDKFSVQYTFESKLNILFDVNGSTYKQYNNSYKTRLQNIRLTPNEVVFKLQVVTVDDAGNYTCFYPNMKVIPECGELLIVLGKPSKPVLHGNATVPSGSNLILSCSSHSTSRPPDLIKELFKMHYIWRRNHVIVQRNYSSNFSVGQISRDDNGVKYSCQAQEQDGLTSDWSPDAVMDVLYGPNQAVLYPDSSIYNVSENRLLEIACSGDCNPACNATWFDQNGRTVSPVNGNRSVFRKRSTRNMTGMYRCELSNTYGNASTNVSINVVFGPIVHNFTVNNNKKVTVKENDVVNFKCTGESNPSPVVTFVSDIYNPIVVNSTLVSPHGFNSSYTISSVNCSHHGRYYCEVSNSIGSTNDSVDINVKCGPKQRDIIRQQTNSSTASWRLSVWAFPMPEENLFFSDQTGAVKSITTGDKYQLKHSIIGENIHDYTFLIHNVDSNDLGNYIIMIQNAEGSKNISITFVGPIKQGDVPVAIIVAAICSVLFLVAAICAAVYINRYKSRKGQVYSIPEEDGNDVGDERSLYARVNKPKIKPCKAKKREGGDVYTTVRKTHTQPKPCTNHLYMASGRPSEGQALIHRDADDRMCGNVNNNCGEKNAEGLTYADLDLAPPTMVNGQPVINSKEEPVVYEQIDFSQTPGPQLPEKIWEKEGSAP